MSQADERLARSVLSEARGRKYRCSSCGSLTPADELSPDFDEEGRRVGWSCESCY